LDKIKVMAYKIRKTLIGQDISVILNDSLGVVLEINDFEEVSRIVQIMNANSDNNCRYEIVGKVR
tara:strand:- start:326 stop:520 length:195 start_codon:yes stop_codon:yes gene_type:complete